MNQQTMFRRMLISIPAFALLFAFSATAGRAAENTLVRRGDLEIRFDAKSRHLSIVDLEAGVLLQRGVVGAQVNGRDVSSADENTPCRATADTGRGEMVLELAEALRLGVRLADDATVELTAAGSLDGPAVFTAESPAGSPAMPAILKEDQGEDRQVLTTVLGAARVPHARSLFNPAQDIAVTASSDGLARWEPAGAWRLVASAAAGKKLLTLKLHRHYYRDTLGVNYYRPIEKRSYWGTAPIVAMTWYGVCGIQQPQSLQALRPEIDWVAKNLLPYAGKLIFQLDDNFDFTDDRAMRELSDYIRSKGMIPGVWFTPFSTVPPKEATAVYQQHPDWFLRDAEGKPIGGFAGRNWGGPLDRGRSYLTNVSQPEAVEQIYKPFWRRASETWNYDFFKIDGQPAAAEGYLKAADGGGIEAFRRGLDVGRQIVGPDKFINGCSGRNSVLLNWLGRVDGSRTGGDTGYKGHAIDVIIGKNYLNNVCWWCDPDAAATLFDKPVEAARINAQARVLTGQQFLTDDYWTKVPPATMRVWQQSFPNLDIYPVNLYPVEDGWEYYDLFDLRIAKPSGTWDVVGLFNYGRAALMKTLDLARLPLESDQVHVFEFWSQTYLGRFGRDAKIARYVQPNDGQLLAIVPAAGDRPTLLSTSRHLSQGGLDLDEVAYRRDGQRWIVSGTSTHLVQGDPYELVFASGSYRLASARLLPADASGGTVAGKNDGDVAHLTVTPGPGGWVRWEAVFVRADTPELSVHPSSLDLEAGQSATLQVTGVGPVPLDFRIATSDPQIRIEPSSGRLAAEQTITVTAPASGRPAGETYRGELSIESAGRKQTVPVRVHVLPPPNLAQQAKASASSIWSTSHDATRINDGGVDTRWNAGRKHALGGAWVELTWSKPVTFSQVVIDEDVDFGLRIQAWRLEAGDETLRPIASGQTLGHQFRVTLPQPITARRLRLTIEKSTQTPTIWEMQVLGEKAAP